MGRLALSIALLSLTACTNGSFTAVSNSAGNSQQSSETTPTNPSNPSTPTQKKILFGVNAHDGRPYYPLTQSEAVFKLLSEKNIRSYRVDIVPTQNPNQVLETLIPLAKKYNIKLRPMIYPSTKTVAYNFAKRYGKDIEIWELGNEQDYSVTGAQDRANVLAEMHKGIAQAASEDGFTLKTAINIMACNTDDVSATARCPKDAAGAGWFLQMAKNSGFNFSYVTFHYYPFYSDKGYWMDMYLSQARQASEKYGVKVMLNETNCANIYQGDKSGGTPGDKACYDSMDQLFTEISTKYADVFEEINMYELFNEPDMDNGTGPEANFGIMFDINKPKKLFDLLAAWAAK